MVSCWTSICPSVCLYFGFWAVTCVTIHLFLPLGMCIDIMKVWVANGQISSVFDSYLLATCPYFCFWTITGVNINGFSHGQILSIFDS